MSDNNEETKTNDTGAQRETPKTEIKQEVAGRDAGASLDSFSNNLIIENQRKMVLQIEALEKKLAEAKKNEEKTINLLREREAADKARVQGELVQRALGEYPILSNAKDVAINMIKGKLSFNDNQQPLWEGKEVDEVGLKGGLENFFKDNSFLLDKSVKTQSVIKPATTIKQQPGTAPSSYDMRTPEGINAFLRDRIMKKGAGK